MAYPLLLTHRQMEAENTPSGQNSSPQVAKAAGEETGREALKT